MILERLRSNWIWIVLTFLVFMNVVAAMMVVHTQYRVRELVVDIERAQEESRRLQEEWRELSIELAKVSLPGYIVEGAKEMGLEPVSNEKTVILQPKPIPRFVTRDQKREGGQS